MSIVTTLSFFNVEAQSDKNPGQFLYFQKNYEFFDINIKNIDYIFTKNRPEHNYLNYVFYLEFLDDYRCRISHTFGDMTFYLAIESDNTIHFVNEPSKYIEYGDIKLDNVDNATFVYNIDGDRLMLYKSLVQYTMNDEDEIEPDSVQIMNYLLGINDSEEKTAFYLENDVTQSGDKYTILISNNILDFQFYIDSSWVGYDRTEYIDSVDTVRSNFSLSTQALLHHQYNADGGVNFIPLKNNTTYNGNTIRGDNFSFSSKEAPDVNFRCYTNIHSGLNQERGNDNIILSYTFHDQVYRIQEGEDFYFTIPSKDETNQLDPLYPYEVLNIKDAKFIKNGAFGSDNPAFADKVKKLQNYNHVLEYEPNNAQYLTTWLYKADDDAEPVWLDRWYYPDFISKREAEKVTRSNRFKLSYENTLDKYYLDLKPDEAREEWTYEDSQKLEAKIRRNTVFDNPSDLTFEAGSKYCYSRLSKDMVNEVCNNLEQYRITDSFDQRGNTVKLEEKLKLNRENWRKIRYDSLDNTNEINLNFDIYLDSKKKIGHQLFGSDYKVGFNIQNRRDVVPYLYYATETEIMMLNNKYEVRHSFNFYDKYKDYVIRFVQGSLFDNVLVFSAQSIYVLSWDLRLKTRVSLLLEDDVKTGESKDKSIYGVNDLHLMKNGKEVNLINYPYGDKSCEAPLKEEVEGTIYFESQETWNVAIPSMLSYLSAPISYIDTTQHFVVIPSNIADILASQNSVMYNGNLYVPYNQHIIKFILCPDRQNDTFAKYVFIDSDDNEVDAIPDKLDPHYDEVVARIEAAYIVNKYWDGESEEIYPLDPGETPRMQYPKKYMKVPRVQVGSGEYDWRADYPIAARKLNYDEYYINYLRKSDSIKDKETIGTIGGNIDVENKIKNIFIDADGNVFGMNFDQYALSSDGDTIYGLYSWDKYIGSGGGWWLFNQSLSRMISDQETSKYAEFQSMNSIDKVCINERGEMALVRNFHNTADNTLDDNYKRVEIYDVAKHKKREYSLDAIDTVYTLDAYKYINEAFEEHSVFVLLCKRGSSIYRIVYDADTEKFTEYYTNIPNTPNEKFYETVNTASLIRYGDSNKLYFNLYFPSNYIYPFHSEVVWDLEDLQQGWYNINVSINLNTASYVIRVNDHKKFEITDEWFKPYVNSNGNMFSNTYYIGCLGKQYGTTMNEILHNGDYDPYACKNSEMQNLSLYKKTMTYGEYQAIRLRNTNINELFITLPCGIRNNVEEIVRYFKYNAPSSMSNRVRINIAGAGLRTEGEYDALRKELLNSINNAKDCLIQIEDIQFI